MKHALHVFKSGFTALIMLVALIALLCPAVFAKIPPRTTGAVDGYEDFPELPGVQPYFAPDAIGGLYDDGARSTQSAAEILPEEMLPASLKHGRTAQGAGATKAAPSAKGAGGWTPTTQPYTPSPAPEISYYPGYSGVFDRDGNQHVLYEEFRQTPIGQAPDAPDFRYQQLGDIYYTVFSEGSFSTPVALTTISVAELEDTSIEFFDVDSDGYVHLVYSKWRWGRDASQPAGTYLAYQHENESIYYRYRAPDGSWSAERCIADFDTGSWALLSAEFGLYDDTLNGFLIETLNNETAPSTYRSRFVFVDGSRDGWSAPLVMRDWAHSLDPGQQRPEYWPQLSASPLDGEVTVAAAIRTLGAGPGLTKVETYTATRDPSGAWSAFDRLFAAADNESWKPLWLYYGSTTDSAMLILHKGLFEETAVLGHTSQTYTMRRSSEGWGALQDVSRCTGNQAVVNLNFILDDFGSFHFAFVRGSFTYDPFVTAWIDRGDCIYYTHEQAGGFSDPETILEYQAGRFSRAIDTELDASGNLHVVYQTHLTHYALGTDYAVYYVSKPGSGGAFEGPVKLSADSTRTTVDVFISPTAGGGLLATWYEARADRTTGEPYEAAVFSRSMRGGTWSGIRNVTAVPGSDAIMHVAFDTVYWYWDSYYDYDRTPTGEQQIFFQTAGYDAGTGTYSNFKYYFVETTASSWSTPEQVLPVDVNGYPQMSVDADGRVHACFDGPDPATGKDVAYFTMQKEPTPPATTYYFAEGTTRENFQEWICIQNPGDTEANVTITYMLGTGENRDQGVVVGPHSRMTVNVNAFLGPGLDVSARVSSDRLIVAERPMYFNYNGVWTGGHDAIGSTDTDRVWYFAEGTTRSGFEEWLTIQNPGDTAADVTITYMLGDGSTRQQLLTVGAATRATVSVNAAVGPDKDVSMKVESPDQAIVAERPMYFDYYGFTGGHDAVGSRGLAKRLYFAEGTTNAGFDTFLCLENPNPLGGTATITYILGDGSTSTGTVDLPPTSRRTLKVNDAVGPEKDVSMVVDSTVPILAERPMYFDYYGFTGGHDAVGAGGPKNSWFFAEGTTNAGFVEWLSLENPGSQDANVTMTFMLGDGSVVTRSATVPAHTRVTLKVNDIIGPDKDVSVAVWSSRGIIAERPMYFDYQGWTGGSDVVGL